MAYDSLQRTLQFLEYWMSNSLYIHGDKFIYFNFLYFYLSVMAICIYYNTNIIIIFIPVALWFNWTLLIVRHRRSCIHTAAAIHVERSFHRDTQIDFHRVVVLLTAKFDISVASHGTSPKTCHLSVGAILTPTAIQITADCSRKRIFAVKIIRRIIFDTSDYLEFCTAHSYSTLHERRDLLCREFFRSVLYKSNCLNYLLPELRSDGFKDRRATHPFLSCPVCVLHVLSRL